MPCWMRISRSLVYRFASSTVVGARSSYGVSVRHHFTYPSPRKLGDLLKVDSVASLSAAELSHVWINAPAATSSSSLIVHSVIAGQSGRKILATAKRVPLFILPAFTKLNTAVASADASALSYETLVINWQDAHCLLTSLAEYRLKQSAAQPFAIATFYGERIDEHGVCLVRTEILHVGVTRRHCEEWIDLIRRLFDSDDARAVKFIDDFANKNGAFDMNQFAEFCKTLQPPRSD